jgi:hypothetical protein
MAITITAQGTEPRATQGAIRKMHKLHTMCAKREAQVASQFARISLLRRVYARAGVRPSNRA